MIRIVAILVFVFYLSSFQPAKADDPTFFLLHPQSKVQITLHGVCRIIENESSDAVAYIPTDSKKVWEDFVSRTDEAGQHKITVSPCE